MNEIDRIEEIEEELAAACLADKKNWVTIYKLMQEVEREKLWKFPENKHSSFTQWVKSFSFKNNIHESVLWQRKSAGSTYEKFVEIQKRKGKPAPNIDDISVPAESLELINKIAKASDNEQVFTELVEQSISGELTRDKLREAHKSVRNKSKELAPKLPIIFTSEQEDGEKLSAELIAEKNNNVVLATDIVTALNSNDWLLNSDIGTKEDDAERAAPKKFSSAYDQIKYRTYTEFPVYTGTSKKSRRIDLLAVENMRSKNQWELNIHAIEIKVSKSDLEKDCKFMEYADFADYMYLAVPSNLVEIAAATAPKNVGIIEVKSDKSVSVFRSPKQLFPVYREVTLQTLTIKLM